MIRDRLIAELRKQNWADPTVGNIVVSEGVVHLWNIVGSDEERRALRIAAENIPGVRVVEDHTISGHPGAALSCDLRHRRSDPMPVSNDQRQDVFVQPIRARIGCKLHAFSSRR